MKQTMCLRGISGDVKGQLWQAENILRAGRLSTLEIVLNDNSVSRRHAEVKRNEIGWFVRDLDSTNGTYVNGVRLGPGERQVHSRDIVQFGKVAMMVELCDVPNGDGGHGNGNGKLEAGRAKPPPSTEDGLVVDQVLVENTLDSSWEGGLERLAFTSNQSPRAGEQLLALLRAGRHLTSLESEEELLHRILQDAVSVLDAQRGAIVLAEGVDQKLNLRALATGHSGISTRFHYSKNLAKRCFDRGESILCCSVEDDDELKMQQSIADGAMASVLCVLLRTPRRRLGVLHLDRSYWQAPFTEEDLRVADGLAAHVSAGIECAQLLKKQRDLFLNTITILAQAVELRDEYTGGHTARVTRYSLLLAEALGLPGKDVELIQIGTPLHDIGKIGIDDSILRKPGRLTPEEFAIMKTHTVKGAAIILTIPDLHPVLPIVRSHHERWDGTGYPDRLAGENIPILARIVAVADAFDAMTSNRPYHESKRGKPPEVAFAEVESMAGKQFDPRCSEAFLDIKPQILDTMTSLKQTSFIPGRAS